MSKAVEGEVMRESRKLTLKQQRFCELYATDREFFGNGTASYIEAYNPSRINPNWYQNARQAAHTLLTKGHICERINYLLEEGGLNDQHVDKQLHFLITQHADFTAKLGGIREYNKLKKRVDGGDKNPNVIVLPVQVMQVEAKAVKPEAE